ncbi:MAG: hypothetical protein JST92_21570 [Deltaproteobacteria bacterium]|nr:hypothetical protein [Deltaproteobacteria bacterium]
MEQGEPWVWPLDGFPAGAAIGFELHSGLELAPGETARTLWSFRVAINEQVAFYEELVALQPNVPLWQDVSGVAFPDRDTFGELRIEVLEPPSVTGARYVLNGQSTVHATLWSAAPYLEAPLCD